MGDVEKAPFGAEQEADIAAKERASSFITPTPDEESKVIRKLDKRLMPIVFFLYMLAVLDRSNLGNAKLAGMEDDINLSGFRYNWLGTIFYIAYIFSQWLLMGWKQFPPHVWCASVVVFWGFVASVQASAFSWSGLMACRFFLGIAEAAFGPGVPLYLTFFYPREKVGLRQGIFISGAALGMHLAPLIVHSLTRDSQCLWWRPCVWHCSNQWQPGAVEVSLQSLSTKLRASLTNRL